MLRRLHTEHGGHRIAEAAADGGRHVIHPRIGLDDGDDLRLRLQHGGIGDIGRGAGGADDEAGILVREELLRHHGIKPDRQADQPQRGQQRKPPEAQHHGQGGHVAVRQPGHSGIQRPRQPPGRRFLRPAQPGRQHRRDGEGDEAGERHGHRQHHGEFAEQPPDQPAHEQQRDEDRDQ